MIREYLVKSNLIITHNFSNSPEHKFVNQYDRTDWPKYNFLFGSYIDLHEKYFLSFEENNPSQAIYFTLGRRFDWDMRGAMHQDWKNHFDKIKIFMNWTYTCKHCKQNLFDYQCLNCY